MIVFRNSREREERRLYKDGKRQRGHHAKELWSLEPEVGRGPPRSARRQRLSEPCYSAENIYRELPSTCCVQALHRECKEQGDARILERRWCMLSCVYVLL